MVIQEFKAGIDSGDLKCDFRVKRKGEQITISIGEEGNWSTTVIGDTLEQALERFKKIILKNVAEGAAGQKEEGA